MIHTHKHVQTVLKFACWFKFIYLFVSFFRFSVFRVTLDHFIRVFLAFVVLGLVSSVASQRIGWEERLRNMTHSVSSAT